MRSAISDLQVFEPRSLKDALRIMNAERGIAPMAGCTDLFVDVNFGNLKHKKFLNLWRLDALRGIDDGMDFVSIGALATYTDMIQSKVVQKHVPSLVHASREVGGVQIQNRGTLGGNIANASPAGDSLPVLAAMEATVVLESAKGSRRVAFDGFYTGYRETVMARDELIVAVEIPKTKHTQWFRKVGTRAAQAISKVVVAAVRAQAPRVAFGSVAATVVRVPRTEAALAAGASAAEAQVVLRSEIQPIDDIRSTGAYRLRICENLLAQFLQETS